MFSVEYVFQMGQTDDDDRIVEARLIDCLSKLKLELGLEADGQAILSETYDAELSPLWDDDPTANKHPVGFVKREILLHDKFAAFSLYWGLVSRIQKKLTPLPTSSV